MSATADSKRRTPRAAWAAHGSKEILAENLSKKFVIKTNKMAPTTTSENEDVQLRIMKTIQSEEANKKWEKKDLVFAHAGKWKRSTVSDVLIPQRNS